MDSEEQFPKLPLPNKGQAKVGEAKLRSATKVTVRGSPQLEEYARVPLLAPIPLPNGGGSGHEIVVYRPSCKTMMEVLDTPKLNVQLERFSKACCKALNGSDELSPFSSADLSSIDGSELSSIIQSMSDDAETVQLDETGDGIEAPVIYTLQRPVSLSPQLTDGEMLYQFAFEARRIGEISEYLDAAGRGEALEFRSFMRIFGKPLQLRVPVMTDAIINALDYLDYLLIRRRILPNFITSRRRWRRVSLAVH